MKRLVVGENVDLSNLVLGGYTVNNDTIKQRFDIKKGELKYNLIHVDDVIIITRRTPRTVNYDVFNNIEEVASAGFEVKQHISWYFTSRVEDIDPEEIEIESDEPVQVETENRIKKFSELNLELREGHRRYNLSELEIINALSVETEEYSWVLFQDVFGAYYIPLEDTREALGYVIAKIDEEFEFDTVPISINIEGRVCDLSRNSIKNEKAEISVNGAKLDFNKTNYEEICGSDTDNIVKRIYKRNDNFVEINKVNLNGMWIYTFRTPSAVELAGMNGLSLLFKAYKSTKKSGGITSKRFNKLESFLRY